MTTTPVRRKRGYKRIDLLLDAAAEVFAEQGYARATMTEIAARASSSIGSLYQFFANKELLSDALIQRYLDKIEESFDTLRDDSERLSVAEIADRLMAISTDMGQRYPFMIELVSTFTPRSQEATRRLRDRLRDILLRKSASLSATRAEAMAEAVLLMLRTASNIRNMPGREMEAAAELATALRCYLTVELAI